MITNLWPDQPVVAERKLLKKDHADIARQILGIVWMAWAPAREDGPRFSEPLHIALPPMRRKSGFMAAHRRIPGRWDIGAVAENAINDVLAAIDLYLECGRSDIPAVPFVRSISRMGIAAHAPISSCPLPLLPKKCFRQHRRPPAVAAPPAARSAKENGPSCVRSAPS